MWITQAIVKQTGVKAFMMDALMVSYMFDDGEFHVELVCIVIWLNRLFSAWVLRKLNSAEYKSKL